ncbi:MAG: tetratricopeptide repeat protein [bacterium]|nr:tetratricopeptide repeat protein [bacterium]
MKRIIFSFAVSIVIGVVGCIQLSFADIIILKNGRRITGNIIGESPTTLTVKTVVGTTTINRNLVAEIQQEDQEVNHIRNGDYYMDKGDYAAATTEYTAALRLNPNLVEVQNKLNEALAKLTQTNIQRLAPMFAEGDRLLTKGFYDDAIKSFREVARTHPEPEYITEANRKIEETCKALIAKGDEYVVLKNYNNALELYAKVTMYNTGELANQSIAKIKELVTSLFAEGDAYLEAQDFAKAAQKYQQVDASYPGPNIDNLVKEKTKQLAVQLRYKPQAGERWKYKMTLKTVMKIPQGTMPTVNQEFDLSGTLRNRIEKVEGDEFDMISSVDGLQLTMNVAGMKQNVPIPDMQRKSFSSRISNLGKPVRIVDLSSISGEGIMGTESMFIGVGSGYLSTLPLDTVRVGEKWLDPINQQINLGSLGKMNVNGRIRYTLVGFEEIGKYACAKIESKYEDIQLTFNGTVKPRPDQPAQQTKITATMNGTGTIYFAYKEGKMVRTSDSMNLEFNIATFSGGGVTPQPMGPTLEAGPMGRGPVGPEGMPPELGGQPPMRGPEAGPAPGPMIEPQTGGTPSPLQQTGQMKFTGTIYRDLMLTE